MPSKNTATTKKKLSATVQTAIVTTIGTIVVALITGFFALAQKNTTAPATDTPVVLLTPTLLSVTTPSNSNNIVPIDSLPVKIYVYESPETEKNISEQSKNTLSKSLDGSSGNVYTHFYSFPEGNKLGAGLYFEFVSPIDLTVYQYQDIQFTIKKNPADKVTLTLTDGKGIGNSNQINLNDLITSEEAGVSVNGDTYTISLRRNFPNATIVKHIYFWVHPRDTGGSVEYEVSGLSFIKP